MPDPTPHDDVDPEVARRLTAAFTALATTDLPDNAPRPGRAPRSVGRRAPSVRRRWGIAAGALVVGAAAVVLALVLGTEVFDARVATTVPPATDVTTPPPVSTAPVTSAPAATSAPATPPSTAAPSSTPSTTAAASTSAPTTSASAGPVACTAAGTHVTAGGDNGGDSHASVLVHVTNTSATPCTTVGYPGVALLDAQGRQLAQAQRTPRGYFGGADPTMVTLAPGATATALVEGLSFDPTTGGACTDAATGLLVTVPDETRSVTVDHPSSLCAQVEVHPLVIGDTGTVQG